MAIQGLQEIVDKKEHKKFQSLGAALTSPFEEFVICNLYKFTFTRGYKLCETSPGSLWIRYLFYTRNEFVGLATTDWSGAE